jgi:hypothetical protein
MEGDHATTVEALGLSLLETRLGSSRDQLLDLFDKDPTLSDACRSYGEAALAEKQLRGDPAQADRLQIVQLFREKLEDEIRGRLRPQG